MPASARLAKNFALMLSTPVKTLQFRARWQSHLFYSHHVRLLAILCGSDFKLGRLRFACIAPDIGDRRLFESRLLFRLFYRRFDPVERLTYADIVNRELIDFYSLELVPILVECAFAVNTWFANYIDMLA